MTLPDLDLDTEPLLDLCADAERRQSLEVVLDIHNRLTWACSLLLARSHFGIEPRVFREQIKSAVVACREFNAALLKIRTVLEDVPYSVHNAIFEHQDEQAPGQAPLLESALAAVSNLNETEHLMMALQAIKNDEQGTGRDIDRAGLRFVASLAGIFEELTGKRPKVSYDPERDKRSGPFVDFVESTLVQLRKAIALKFEPGGDWQPEQRQAALALADLNVQALVRLHEDDTSNST